jgi:diguanylate cyclase (GGDEF)-like protein
LLYPNVKTKVLLFIKYLFFIFLCISLAYYAVYVAIQYNNNIQKRANIEKNENSIIENETNMIVSKVGNVLSDLMYLSDSVDVNSFDLDGSFKTALQWKAFLDRKQIYDKVCYYGRDGSSIVTIYSKSGSYISNDGNPDRNSDSLFEKTISLQKGQAYISRPIPKPLEGPTGKSIVYLMQFATPLYGSGGSVKGIVVADYYINDLLHDFAHLSSTSSGKVYLLDSNAFSISGSENIATGKMDISGLHSFAFSSQYPNAWKYMKNNLLGQISIDKGFFTFGHVLLFNQSYGRINGINIVMDTGDWIAISVIDILNESGEIGEIFETNGFNLMYKLLDNQLFEFLMILAVSALIAILFIKNKLSKDAIKYFSEYDELTDSFNRRAGFYRLRELGGALWRNSKKLSVCYVDIDNLKQVNDSLGHDTGDELIKTVAAAIQKNIRQSDFMIRMGGDEFLLVLIDTGEKEAEEIWQRIKSEFNTINRHENRKYIVSASHGIEECIIASNCNIETIIQKADQKMYKEKNANKKSFKVIKAET